MGISRRDFLLGTAGAAAGLILPSYYQRALEFIDRAGQPLLETSGQPLQILTAVKSDMGEMPWKLGIGNPWAGPPPMTLKQFVERYDGVLEHYAWELRELGEEPDWDSQVDWGLSEGFLDTWFERDDPQMKAYELLKDLDLGPDLSGRDAVGELHLEAGSSMVSSYWYADAPDDISISLLQERLNALGTGIEIRIEDPILR